MRTVRGRKVRTSDSRKAVYFMHGVLKRGLLGLFKSKFSIELRKGFLEKIITQGSLKVIISAFKTPEHKASLFNFMKLYRQFLVSSQSMPRC